MMRKLRSPDKRARVLDALAKGVTLSEAAKAAGMSKSYIYEWRCQDEEFAAECQRAYDLGTDVFVQEAKRRAFKGSDVLLIFLLKARAPHVFNRRMIETTVDVHTTQEEVVHFFLPPNFRDEPEAFIEGEPLPPEVQARLKKITEPLPTKPSAAPRQAVPASSSWARIAKSG